MKMLPASVALLVGGALLTAACAKHDDATNTTITNETLVTEESGGFNEAAPDLNAAADTPIVNDTLGNATVGNAAATPN